MNINKLQLSINTIAKGSAITLAGTAIGHLLNFFFKMVTARHFGPEDYGWFSLGLSVLVIAANISGLGMNQSVARFIPFFKKKNEQKKLSYTIKYAAGVSFLASLIFGSAVFLASPWLSKVLHGNQGFTLFLMLFAVVVPFEVLFDYSLGVLRGMKDMRMMVFCNNIILWVVRIIFLGLIVLGSFDIKWMVFPYLASYLVGLGASWIYIIKKEPLLRKDMSVTGHFNSSVLRKELFTYSLPLVFSTVTTMFRKRFDIILVGFFLTASQVGIYNAALPIAMFMTIFLFAINRIAMPVASELFGGQSLKEMAYVYKSIARWSLMITLPVFFVLFFYPENIVRIFFGEEYVEAANVLRILSVGSFVNAISGSFGEFLQSYSKTMPIFLISVTGTLLNLMLMVIFIPMFGVEGAAFAFTSSLVWMCFLGNYCLYRYKKILPFSRGYFKSIIFGSVVFAAGYIFHNSLMDSISSSYILTGVTGLMVLLVYLSVLYLFAADDFDKEIVQKIKMKCLGVVHKAMN